MLELELELGLDDDGDEGDEEDVAGLFAQPPNIPVITSAGANPHIARHFDFTIAFIALGSIGLEVATR